MNVLLEQSTEAAFPDRGEVGLKITMSEGNDGAYLMHDWPEPAERVHVRILLSIEQATPGRVDIMGALSDGDDPVWFLTLDGEQRRVQLHLDGHAQVIDVVLTDLNWNCIEVETSAQAGEAALWLNGREIQRFTNANPQTIARAWIGGIFKETALTGQFQLDEWAISTAFIGPVIIEPAQPHAADPARWLLIYNSQHPDAAQWAEYYRSARNVPYANCLDLPGSTNETITPAEFTSLAQSVNQYLASTGLEQQIMGILVGFGMPGYVAYEEDLIEPVAGLMQTDSTGRGHADNNIFSETPAQQRPSFDALAGQRMTARIDGHDLAAALNLIQRAQTLGEITFHPDQQAQDLGLYLDPFRESPGGLQNHIAEMIEWFHSPQRQRLRIPAHISAQASDPDHDASFQSIRRDGFFWGWHIDTTPDQFYDDPPGHRVLSVVPEPHEPTGGALREASEPNWLTAPLSAGYAAAAASTRVFTAQSLPRLPILMPALQRGWTLAEAWHLSLAGLRGGMELLGDPLLQLDWSARGWSIHGPLTRLSQAGEQTLIQAAPIHKTRAKIPEPHRPAQGQTALYVVRQVDRDDHAAPGHRCVRIANVHGQAREPVMPPLWPDRDDWPVKPTENGLAFDIIWERPASSANAHIAHLESQSTITETPVHEASQTIDPRARLAQLDLDAPDVSRRYRWRIESPEGSIWLSPWSAFHQPDAPAQQPPDFVID